MRYYSTNNSHAGYYKQILKLYISMTKSTKNITISIVITTQAVACDKSGLLHKKVKNTSKINYYLTTKAHACYFINIIYTFNYE